MRFIGISDYPIGSIKPEVMQMLRMCEALALKGCHVVVYVPSGGQRINWSDIEQIYGQFRLHFPIRTMIDISVPKQAAKLPGILSRLSLHGWDLLRAVVITSQLGNSDGVIMTRDIYLAWLQIKLNRPVIFEMMSMPSKPQLLPLKQMCFSSNLQCIIAISRGLAKSLVNTLGFTPRNLVVLPMGVNLDQFASDISKDKARQLVGLAKDVPIVVYTGASLRRDRELDIIIQAAKALPDVLFVIVGGRKEEIEILSRFAEQLEARNVSFVGYVFHSRVMLYQKAADILLLLGSSKDKHQSQHASYAKMFEYMASGRPIIAHDIPAIREILSNEVNALLIKPGESDELIFAINRLIQDKHLAYRLAEKARIDVEKYTWQERARKLLEYLHKNNQ